MFLAILRATSNAGPQNPGHVARCHPSVPLRSPRPLICAKKDREAFGMLNLKKYWRVKLEFVWNFCL